MPVGEVGLGDRLGGINTCAGGFLIGWFWLLSN
jgi:hypothetical protein